MINFYRLINFFLLRDAFDSKKLFLKIGVLIKPRIL